MPPPGWGAPPPNMYGGGVGGSHPRSGSRSRSRGRGPVVGQMNGSWQGGRWQQVPSMPPPYQGQQPQMPPLAWQPSVRYA